MLKLAEPPSPWEYRCFLKNWQWFFFGGGGGGGFFVRLGEVVGSWVHFSDVHSAERSKRVMKPECCSPSLNPITMTAERI